MSSINIETKIDELSNMCEYTINTTDGSKPFLFKRDKFVHVCSYSDMLLIPEDVGTLYRSDKVSLIFRHKNIMNQSLEQIQQQLHDLEKLSLHQEEGHLFYSSWEE